MEGGLDGEPENSASRTSHATGQRGHVITQTFSFLISKMGMIIPALTVIKIQWVSEQESVQETTNSTAHVRSYYLAVGLALLPA